MMFNVVNLCKQCKSNFEYSKRYLSALFSSKNNALQWPPVVFSGIQPSGVLHLGNYLGAISQWVDLQNTPSKTIYSIVDLHSITLPQDPKELKSNIFMMTASLIACGIDPSKSILFLQSQVPEHAALSWILGTMTTMSRLYHFPQYKEKCKDLKDIPLGLFIYPVLQSADILLYKATHVPVGEDQIQHLHLTQHLLNTFNNKFGVTFPMPDYIVQKGSKVRNLREPEKKMSKSHQSAKSRIEITDTPDLIMNKIKKAVTDFDSVISFDLEKRPGVSNLILIHSLLSGKSTKEICKEYSRLDTSQYKIVVAEEVIAKLKPIQKELIRLLNSAEYLESILDAGTAKARYIAKYNWAEIKDKVGLKAECKDIDSVNNLTVMNK